MRELDGVLLHAGFASTRHRQALARRLGWDGAGPATLAEAGAASGYTRERVRQLEQRARERFGATVHAIPTTRAATRLLLEAAPGSRAELAALLAEHRLSCAPFDPAGVVTAARLLGVDAALTVHGATLLGPGDVEVGPIVQNIARELVGRGAATTVAAVARFAGLSQRRAQVLLEASDSIAWLDGADWFTILPIGGRAGAVLGKFAGVATSAQAEQVRRALAALRVPIELPVEVVAALLRGCRPRRHLADRAAGRRRDPRRRGRGAGRERALARGRGRRLAAGGCGLPQPVAALRAGRARLLVARASRRG
ncbi:MAG: sigma factor-like helix-turn-helix DNA-binding protein [Actinomycetota bacterium]